MEAGHDVDVQLQSFLVFSGAIPADSSSFLTHDIYI